MATGPAEEYRSIPELMRAARGSYAQAIREGLEAEGIDDLPRNGSFVLSYLSRDDEPVVMDMIQRLGVTKQAVSQLLDTLVVRGFITREIDPDDRRRMTMGLTDRGRGAAAAIFEAVTGIDEQLAETLSPGELAGLRAGLAALGRIKDGWKEAE
jgi:DNA-binding MarR family transcriptional regulator